AIDRGWKSCFADFRGSGRIRTRSNAVDLGRPIHLFRGARNRSEASNGTAAERLPNGIDRVHYLESTNNVVIVGTDLADDVSLLDIIDHILNAGVVIRGSLVISLAGVDLVYLGLDVILTSVETRSEASNGTAAERLPTGIDRVHYLESTNNVVIVGTDLADDVSLLDIIDHILNAGVVIRGSLVISLAGVDLVYLGLDVIRTSVETAIRYLQLQPPSSGSP